MKIRMLQIAVLGLAAVLAGGCSPPVLKQDIPVTTNPLGARIYANGEDRGVTPATVSLERNRNHVLTFVKENYRQEDVVIQRLYQKERSYLKAIQSGIDAGLFFKNPAMGMNSGMSSLSRQEETGEAYILSPPAVKISLTPLAGAPAGAAAAAEAKAAPPGDGPEPPAGIAEAPPLERGEVARQFLKMGAGAALSQVRPLEKKVETSSSSHSQVKPDGTRVTEKSSSSVGVSLNPAGLIDALDILFK